MQYTRGCRCATNKYSLMISRQSLGRLNVGIIASGTNHGAATPVAYPLVVLGTR
jgi:hypothetical protein